MQLWIEHFPYTIPPPEVLSVFMNLEDPDRALAELGLGADSAKIDSLFLDNSVAPPEFQHSYFPILFESGRWRAGAPTLLYSPTGPVCPYEMPMPSPPEEADGHSSLEDYEAEYPKIPGLDFNDRSDQTLGSFGSFSEGSSHISKGKFLEIRKSRLANTHLTSSELMGLYQERMVHLSWDIRGQGKGTEGAWLTWTVHDDEGRLWYGSLAITAAGVNAQQIWMLLRTTYLPRP